MPRLTIEDCVFVPIVGDGAIGDPRVLGGRLLPVLIVDCSGHRPLEELIFAHEHTPPGDVVASWGWKFFSRKTVFLTLRFARPIETVACLAFDVGSQGGLVEWIVNARAVYLQPRSSGKVVSEGMEKPKILVEVPASATFPIWKDLHRKTLEKIFIKRGLSRQQAREAVQEYLARMHEIQFRLPPRTGQEGDA
jgi:hypothetical protein